MAIKQNLGRNVFEATKERIAWTFDNFEKVYLAFSGGKDSTVMLHMVADEAAHRNKKVGVFFIDLEGQYRLTIEHIQNCFEKYKNLFEVYWICLPLHLRNAVSVYEPHWLCWDAEVEGAWIRKPPKNAIRLQKTFPFFSEGMEFEEFMVEFGKWYAGGKRTACMVGIRTDESFCRYGTLVNKKKRCLGGKRFTSYVSPNVYNVYPIYDWKAEDIWTYHGRNPDKSYNKIYDRMHMAGLSINQMRICQPYGDDQRRGLFLFHLLEPETWARVVARVNGANGGARYVQERGNISGYGKITKPAGHTWESFARMLINSMPPKIAEHYENKVFKFIEWWMGEGYPAGIPDVADPLLEAGKKAPSWRRICKALLRNDYWCKGLGFAQQKSGAYERYLELMRKKKDEKDFRLVGV